MRLERNGTVLSARLMTPVQTMDAYLIARSVYHRAADGHFGESSEVRVSEARASEARVSEARVSEARVSEVRFHGFDAASSDVKKLARRDTMPSAATEQAIRAMPARGPCVLDRLAEWQLSATVISRESMFENLCHFIPLPAHGAHGAHGEESGEEIRIPVFSTNKEKEEERLVRKHIEGTVSGRRVEGRLFLEPFWTPKGVTSIVSWIENSTDAALKGHYVRPVRLYALVVRRILVYYVRDDNNDDFPDLPALEGPLTRAELEARTALGVYPVTVRIPGVGGALVSFRFIDPTRERFHVRVDAYIDANFSVVLVLGGQTFISMTERCVAFARYSVSQIYPGALVSGPVPRVKGLINTKRRRP